MKIFITFIFISSMLVIGKVENWGEMYMSLMNNKSELLTFQIGGHYRELPDDLEKFSLNSDFVMPYLTESKHFNNSIGDYLLIEEDKYGCLFIRGPLKNESLKDYNTFLKDLYKKINNQDEKLDFCTIVTAFPPMTVFRNLIPDESKDMLAIYETLDLFIDVSNNISVISEYVYSGKGGESKTNYIKFIELGDVQTCLI